MKQFLEVGKINNTHAVRGEMKMQLWCDGIDFLKQFDTLYMASDGSKPVKLLSVRGKNDAAIIKLDGVDTVEKAQQFKGKVLYCNRDDAVIDENANFIADLIGCYVVDIDTDEEYGKVIDVMNYGSCDIYEIESWGKHSLIPATEDIVKEINTEYQVIKIKAIKGLFDEN